MYVNTPFKQLPFSRGSHQDGSMSTNNKTRYYDWLLQPTILRNAVGEGELASILSSMTWAMMSTSCSFSCSDLGAQLSFLSLAAITPRCSRDISRRLWSMLRLLNVWTYTYIYTVHVISQTDHEQGRRSTRKGNHKHPILLKDGIKKIL